MDDSLIRTSKFLSYVLRHNPDAIGLSLGPGGWADVSELIACARGDGRSLTRSQIEHVIAAGEKSRFRFSPDGSKIRANYGHSVNVDLDLKPRRPPEHLFHGTAEHALPTIRDEGLTPQSRQYVHLSSTRDEAFNVGKRHGTPVVLTVRARSLHENDYSLYESTDAVWLVREVPPHFLQIP